jgi:mRNA interferase RelE/StbE
MIQKGESLLSNRYEVQFTNIALKNLKQYPQKDQRLILTNIEKLADDPFSKTNVKKLVNFGISYRLKVGNYRVFFEREDALKIIDIIDILPRKKSY